MSRFTERMERDLDQIADRATPSVAAWEAIQRRIEEQGATEPTSDLIFLTADHAEPRARARAWMLVAVAAAALAFVGGLTLAGDRDREERVPAGASDPGAGPVSAQPLPFPGSQVEPGRYSTPLLGVPVTLTIDGEWSLTEAGASSIALHRPAGEREIDVATARWIFLTRLGGWNTRAEAIDPSFRTTGSIEPNDIDRWLDQNDIVVLDRRDTRVDGRPAIVVDVQVDPEGTSAPLNFPRDPDTLYNDTCGPATEPCLWYRSIPEQSDTGRGPRPDPVVHAGHTRRMWLIPIQGLEPVLIEAVVPVGDEGWLDDVETTVIASLELGDDAPPLSTG